MRRDVEEDPDALVLSQPLVQGQLQDALAERRVFRRRQRTDDAPAQRSVMHLGEAREKRVERLRPAGADRGGQGHGREAGIHRLGMELAVGQSGISPASPRRFREDALVASREGEEAEHLRAKAAHGQRFTFARRPTQPARDGAVELPRDLLDPLARGIRHEVVARRREHLQRNRRHLRIRVHRRDGPHSLGKRYGSASHRGSYVLGDRDALAGRQLRISRAVSLRRSLGGRLHR